MLILINIPIKSHRQCRRSEENFRKDSVFKHYRAKTEMEMCWVWLNTLIWHAQQLEQVGLADMTQQWICRLVLRHRTQFHVTDELRLLDLFLTLPPGWLARWASKLLKLPPIDQLEGKGFILHF